MKKILLALAVVLLLCWEASAQVYVVCDPQSDADGYGMVIDSGVTEYIAYQTAQFSDGKTYAIVKEVTAFSGGQHSMIVWAYKDDPLWGRRMSPTVPFSFPVPTVGSPGHMGLKRQ